MVTDLIEIDRDSPEPRAIERAAAVIRRGGVVAMPTDALYSLVADPFSLHAVAMVFRAKGREIHRALPLLVSDVLMAENLAKELSRRFYLLARLFWPGPLTIIVPASGKVPLKVTGHAERVALRQSRSKVTAALLEHIQQPLISTSANISGQPTCRSGIEVFGTMDGRIELVLDGGFCSGLGSTTVDICDPEWKLIREGAIPAQAVADALRHYKDPGP